MLTRKITMVLAVLLAGGCAKDQQASNGMSRSDADRLKAEKAKYDAQIDNTPLTANTRFAAGQLAESQGEIDRAVEQYQDALKIDPKHPDALYRLGYIWTAQKQYSKAIDCWNRYIKVTNGAAAGYSNLGFCMELAERFPEAESAYKAGIAKEPANQTCHVNYGLMLARQGRMSDAAAQLSAVLAPAEVHYDLASILESQGKNIDAKAEYQKALQFDPKMSDAKTRLAGLD